MGKRCSELRWWHVLRLSAQKTEADLEIYVQEVREAGQGGGEIELWGYSKGGLNWPHGEAGARITH